MWASYPLKTPKTQITFNLSSKPTTEKLVLEHLSSASAQAPNGGYSPIDIIINEESSYPLLNDFSPGSNSNVVDKINIPVQLKEGTNTIKIKLKDAVTHYWIKNLMITK